MIFLNSLISTFFVFLRDLPGIDDVDNQADGQNSHAEHKAAQFSGHKACQDHKDSADYRRDASEPLTLFPGLLVLHAPGSPQADHGIHPQLRHDIPDYQHA